MKIVHISGNVAFASFSNMIYASVKMEFHMTDDSPSDPSSHRHHFRQGGGDEDAVDGGGRERALHQVAVSIHLCGMVGS